MNLVQLTGEGFKPADVLKTLCEVAVEKSSPNTPDEDLIYRAYWLTETITAQLKKAGEPVPPELAGAINALKTTLGTIQILDKAKDTQ